MVENALDLWSEEVNTHMHIGIGGIIALSVVLVAMVGAFIGVLGKARRS